jgi:hypothetical protein
MAESPSPEPVSVAEATVQSDRIVNCRRVSSHLLSRRTAS